MKLLITCVKCPVSKENPPGLLAYAPTSLYHISTAPAPLSGEPAARFSPTRPLPSNWPTPCCSVPSRARCSAKCWALAVSLKAIPESGIVFVYRVTHLLDENLPLT